MSPSDKLSLSYLVLNPDTSLIGCPHFPGGMLPTGTLLSPWVSFCSCSTRWGGEDRSSPPSCYCVLSTLCLGFLFSPPLWASMSLLRPSWRVTALWGLVQRFLSNSTLEIFSSTTEYRRLNINIHLLSNTIAKPRENDSKRHKVKTQNEKEQDRK